MKKTLFTLGLSIIILGSASAQFELKGLVGTNFTSFSNPPSGIEYAAKAGYQFGAGVLIGDKFYVEPGIHFLRNSKTITDETTEYDFSQNFVKIPVYAGYHLLGHESGALALRVFGGPAALIPGKIKKGEDQITKEDIENMMWLVDAGVGVDILFLFVELNYEYSFSNHFTDSSNDSKHKGFVINAGIHLDF